MRRCPFTNCQEEIPAEMFACRRHWWKLKRVEMKRISKAYRDWQTGALSPVGLRRIQAEVVQAAEERMAARA